MRLYTAQIPEKPQEKTLLAYLTHALPLLPAHVLREAFARRDVRMDGRRAGPDEAPVQGAAVQVYTLFDAHLPVVYEDEQILLLNKPAGISCEDDGRGGMTVDGLLRARPDHPRLCHRLDNQTSGLLLSAKTKAAEACLLEAFQTRSLTKRYECVVKGQPRPPEQTAIAYIFRDPRLGRMRVVSHPSPETKRIETAYETLNGDRLTSRLRVTLLTGRMHQIRAHLAALQHPVLGDDVYGDRAFNQRMRARRLMLCATELILHTDGPLGYLKDQVFTVNAPF